MHPRPAALALALSLFIGACSSGTAAEPPATTQPPSTTTTVASTPSTTAVGSVDQVGFACQEFGRYWLGYQNNQPMISTRIEQALSSLDGDDLTEDARSQLILLADDTDAYAEGLISALDQAADADPARATEYAQVAELERVLWGGLAEHLRAAETRLDIEEASHDAAGLLDPDGQQVYDDGVEALEGLLGIAEAACADPNASGSDSEVSAADRAFCDAIEAYFDIQVEADEALMDLSALRISPNEFDDEARQLLSAVAAELDDERSVLVEALEDVAVTDSSFASVIHDLVEYTNASFDLVIDVLETSDNGADLNDGLNAQFGLGDSPERLELEESVQDAANALGIAVTERCRD